MSCGITEEELAALEAEAANRRPAAPSACRKEAGCGGNECGNPDSCSTKTEKATGSWATAGPQRKGSTLCMKCKTAKAAVLVRQREPLCQACLETGISGKVRALKSHKLLLPNDHVVIAFSGGFSSQALLCNVLPMRKEASTPRKERGKIELDLTVVHINEAAAHGLPAGAAETHAQAVVAAAARCGAGFAPFRTLVVPLADVFQLLDGDRARGRGGGRGGARPQPGGQDALREGGQGAEVSLARGAEEGAEPGEPAGSQATPGGVQPSEPQRCPGLEGTTDGASSVDPPAPAPGAAGAEVSVAAAAAAPPDHPPKGRSSALGGAVGAAEREARLQALMQSVSDPTGREDLLRHLRSRLLAATAAALGASKVLAADTGTAVAARIIADTAKGRGYSLPGDIQLVDGRGAAVGEPPVICPMREVTSKEAVYFCRLRGLSPVPLAFLADRPPRRSINDLAAVFIEGLQANLPSTVFTVLRTAAALRPFPFNSPGSLSPPPPPPSTAAAAAAANTAAGPQDATGNPPGTSAPTAPTAGSPASATVPAPAPSDALSAGGQRVPPCCALCRAPLSQREREAITAAAAVAAARLNAVSQSAAAEQQDQGPGQSLTEGASEGAEGSRRRSSSGDGAGRCEEEEEEGDLSAPFCFSCRSQILLSPGHPDVVASGAGVGFSAGTRLSYGATLGAESRTLALLPAALRGRVA